MISPRSPLPALVRVVPDPALVRVAPPALAWYAGPSQREFEAGRSTRRQHHAVAQGHRAGCLPGVTPHSSLCLESAKPPRAVQLAALLTLGLRRRVTFEAWTLADVDGTADGLKFFVGVAPSPDERDTTFRTRTAMMSTTAAAKNDAMTAERLPRYPSIVTSRRGDGADASLLAALEPRQGRATDRFAGL